MPTSVYHITHIRNLPSILEAGGLMATNSLRRQRINYVDIAYQGIQDRRATTRVPCGAEGVLHDYVPFYFAPRSPMLYTIHKGNVESYREGQAPVIENLGLKPRRFTAALLLNISTFTKYMLKYETWKKPILTDFTQHQNKSRYCGAHWDV